MTMTMMMIQFDGGGDSSRFNGVGNDGDDSSRFDDVAIVTDAIETTRITSSSSSIRLFFT